MDKKQIITIAVVVIIVIAAAAVMATQFTKDSDDDDAVKETGRLMVYGNANNDDYMDERDVEFLQHIIDVNSDDDTTNDIDWATNYHYADANCDGVVDSKDIDYLKGILNQDSCRIYYDETMTHYGSTVQWLNYPVKHDTIGCGYFCTAYLLVILGVWDKVTDIDSGIVKRAGYGFDVSHCETSYGDSFNKITTDAIYNSKVDLFVGHYNYNKQTREDLRAMNSDTQMVLFCTSGVKCTSQVLTLGFLLGGDAIERSHAYAAYVDKVYDYLNEKIGEVSDEDLISFYMTVGTDDTGNITVSSSNSNYTSPVVAWVETIPGLKNAMEHGDGTSINATRSSDFFLDNPSDYILVAVSSINYMYDTQEATDYYAEHLYKYTNAYNKGNILGVAYSNSITSYYAPSVLALLASEFFPDKVDSSYAMDLLKEFYNTFTDTGYNDTIGAYAGVYRMTSS